MQNLKIEDYYTEATSAGVITMLDKPEALNAVITLMFTAFGVNFASEKLTIKFGHLHEELGLYKPLETVEDIHQIKVWYDGHQLAMRNLLRDTDHLMAGIRYNIYNPVIGCPMGCPYCHTSNINEQFHLIDDWKKPVFRGPYSITKDENGNNIPELFIKRPKNGKPIAWMLTYYSDFGCWEPEWQKNVMEQVMAAIQYRKNRGEKPDTFSFLTKNPHHICLDFIPEGAEYPEITFGCTVDKNENTIRILNLIQKVRHFRPSIMITYQPLLEYIEPIYLKELAETFGADRCSVIISPEISNSGQAKEIPFSWMKDIIDTCEELGISVFEHNCLKELIESEGYSYHPQKNGVEIYDEE